MIKQYLNKDTMRFCASAKTCEEAIQLAAQPLVDLQKIKPEYVDDIMQALYKFGPYMVLIPHIALAHAEPSDHVLEECMSLLTLKEPVEFHHPSNDPVSIIFILASPHKDKHMEVLMEISQLFLKDGFIAMLANCATADEFLKYLGEEE